MHTSQIQRNRFSEFDSCTAFHLGGEMNRERAGEVVRESETSLEMRGNRIEKPNSSDAQINKLRLILETDAIGAR